MEAGVHISSSTISYVDRFSHLASNGACQLTRGKNCALGQWVTDAYGHIFVVLFLFQFSHQCFESVGWVMKRPSSL